MILLNFWGSFFTIGENSSRKSEHFYIDFFKHRNKRVVVSNYIIFQIKFFKFVDRWMEPLQLPGQLLGLKFTKQWQSFMQKSIVKKEQQKVCSLSNQEQRRHCILVPDPSSERTIWNSMFGSTRCRIWKKCNIMR